MSEEGTRFCPYCGIKLEKPYWAHIEKVHAEKYAKKETWAQLYSDYKKIGMDEKNCLLVISELFNATAEEIKSFLKNKKVL